MKPEKRLFAPIPAVWAALTAPVVLAALAVLTALTVACGGPAPDSEMPGPAAPGPAAERSLAGTWRAVLASPGGELPFTLEIDETGGEPRAVVRNGEEEAPLGVVERDGALDAVIRNGEEAAPLSAVKRNGSRVVLEFDWYDAEIIAELGPDGETLDGTWRKTAPGGDSTLPFTARRGDERRFLPVAETGAGDAVDTVAGVWAAVFRDEDGSETARAEFRQDGETVTGTFLTPTGDYRFLAGTYANGLLRLSTFDGAHAFLFTARARDDGTLAGDFWSRDTYHATWTAHRPGDGEAETILPDAWSLVGLTNDEGRFRFAFPDLDGETVTSEDPRFDGKVVLVNLFGSWCPNCNDEAPLLAEWHRRYRDRGLEIVGLAYEFTGDPERDRKVVRRFAERYGIEYPLLLAGTSDKKAAAETLPDVDKVVAYPTSIFIGRDGRVRKIHSGFSGPGTGEHYDALVAELEHTIEALLAEPA